MQLLTDELRKSIPALYSQNQLSIENKIVHVKFYFPLGKWIWYVVEGSEEENDFIFFGFVIGFEKEWKYFSLIQLENIDVSGYKVERDLNFKPTKFRDLQIDL
jgi:hypothetical protein